jgi:hypothetical protein
MNILPKEELNKLIVTSKGSCVSIYMPANKSGPEAEQNSIRFKNLLREAEQRLVDQGHKLPEAKDLLAPAGALLTDSFFWRHQNEGLAVFVSPEIFKYFRLPLTFGQNVFIGDSFNVTPLLPMFIADGRFYILALNKKNIRLFQCTRMNIQEVELVKVPKSIDELLRYNVSDQNITYHVVGNRGQNKAATAVFHGHGAGTDNAAKKKDVLEFFQQLDRYLRKFLEGERAPMILAGVEYQQSIYREASNYPNLMAQGINGSPDALSNDELHRKAWSILEPYFKKSLENAIDLFKQGLAAGRCSTDLAEVVKAAYQGRVETLFVTIGLQQWGKYHTETGEVEIHDSRQTGDRSLQNLAAIQTLLKNGSVYVVESREAPVHTPLAALLRY